MSDLYSWVDTDLLIGEISLNGKNKRSVYFGHCIFETISRHVNWNAKWAVQCVSGAQGKGPGKQHLNNK